MPDFNSIKADVTNSLEKCIFGKQCVNIGAESNQVSGVVALDILSSCVRERFIIKD